MYRLLKFNLLVHYGPLFQLFNISTPLFQQCAANKKKRLKMALKAVSLLLCRTNKMTQNASCRANVNNFCKNCMQRQCL